MLKNTYRSRSIRTQRDGYKHTLMYAVQDVLELPRKDRCGKSAEIVRAVFRSIVNALLRGERVCVYGLGKFEVRYRKEKRYGDLFLGPRMTPGKNYVHFTPSWELRRSLNVRDAR